MGKGKDNAADCIREVLSSKFGHDTEVFSCFLSVPPDKGRNNTSNRPWPLPSQSSPFHNSSTIRRYTDKGVPALNWLITPRRRMGKWSYSSIIIDLGTRWRWVVCFAPQLLYLRRKSPRYPLRRRLGGPQSWSGHLGEKILAPAGNRNPAVQPVAIPTERSRLSVATDNIAT
jgi:hypothetical protein